MRSRNCKTYLFKTSLGESFEDALGSRHHFHELEGQHERGVTLQEVFERQSTMLALKKRTKFMELLDKAKVLKMS